MEKIKVGFCSQEQYFRFSYENDLDEIYNVTKIHINPDFYDKERYNILLEHNDRDIWIFKRGEFIPENILKQLKGKKVWISTEPIERNDVIDCLNMGHPEYFDAIYHYDKTDLNVLSKLLNKEVKEFYLPVAIDTYKEGDLLPKYDLIFLGRPTPKRETYLRTIMKDYDVLWIANGLYGDEAVRAINLSDIGLNLNIDDFPQLAPRIQMMMACNIMVMSPPLKHNDMFKAGIHYVEFNTPEEFRQKFIYYLYHTEERNKIADAGYELVKSKLNARDCWKRLIDEVMENGQSKEEKRG